MCCIPILYTENQFAECKCLHLCIFLSSRRGLSLHVLSVPPAHLPLHHFSLCLSASRVPDQHRSSPLDFEDKSKQRRENALSYQEALRQQVQLQNII